VSAPSCKHRSQQQEQHRSGSSVESHRWRSIASGTLSERRLGFLGWSRSQRCNTGSRLWRALVRTDTVRDRVTCAQTFATAASKRPARCAGPVGCNPGNTIGVAGRTKLNDTHAGFTSIAGCATEIILAALCARRTFTKVRRTGDLLTWLTTTCSVANGSERAGCIFARSLSTCGFGTRRAPTLGANETVADGGRTNAYRPA
jgi:hypothetical protein